MPNPAVEEVRI